MGPIEGILMVLMLVCAFAWVPHLYIMISHLRENGYNASYFFVLPTDITDYISLIRKTENIREKKKYINTFKWFIYPCLISLASFIGFALILFLRT